MKIIKKYINKIKNEGKREKRLFFVKSKKSKNE